MEATYTEAADEKQLFSVVKLGWADEARRLLENGVNPNCRNMTPLHWAAANGHNKAALVLLEFGADKALKNTPATLARANGYNETAKIIDYYVKEELVKEPVSD